MKKTTPKNILLINFKYFGDLIVSTPAIRSIKTEYPSAKLTLLTRQEYSNVLQGYEFLDEIISFNPSVKKQKGLKRIKQELNFIKMLRSKKFDSAISLQAGDRYVFWTYFSGASIRVAPIQNKFAFLLTGKVNVYEEKISYLDYYSKIAEAFGATIISKKTDFPLNADFSKWTYDFLNRNKISKDDSIIGLHPGASEPTKKWPIENYLKVCESLAEKHKVILFLGPAEKELFRIDEKYKELITIADTSENIQHLAWLISKCSLLICNDSGARHLSAALKVPTITLFTDDKIVPWKFYSEEDKQYFILGKRNTINISNPYLDGIKVEDVLKKIRDILY